MRYHNNFSFWLSISLACTSLAQASSVLFTGGTIIAFDEDSQDLDVVRNGSIMVTNDRIVGIWPPGELPSAPTNTEVIDATGKIITPGFIDTHRHGWQTLFKTLMSNATIAEYFGRFNEYFVAGRLDAKQVYISQLTGLYEALNAGVTTSLDHAHHTWSVDTSYAGLNASIDSGSRLSWAYTFHNVTNYTISDQLVDFRSMAEAATSKDTPVSLVNAVFELAREFDVSVITTHGFGGAFGYSNGPRELHAFSMLNTSIPVVFSHASFFTPEES